MGLHVAGASWYLGDGEMDGELRRAAGFTHYIGWLCAFDGHDGLETEAENVRMSRVYL